MTDLKAKFDECFKAEFPATYEAILRGEPKPHGDFSNAWWGFREGYRCAMPTSEPMRPRVRPWRLTHLLSFSALVAVFMLGYYYPRDVEIESSKPIVLNYEITPEAQKALMLRSVEGFPKCEAEEAR
jgi:hypothetical protein